MPGGLPALMRRNHELAILAQKILCQRLGLVPVGVGNDARLDGGGPVARRAADTRDGRSTRALREKGDRPTNFDAPERPAGCFAQMGPIPFPTPGRLHDGARRDRLPLARPAARQVPHRGPGILLASAAADNLAHFRPGVQRSGAVRATGRGAGGGGAKGRLAVGEIEHAHGQPLGAELQDRPPMPSSASSGGWGGSENVEHSGLSPALYSSRSA